MNLMDEEISVLCHIVVFAFTYAKYQWFGRARVSIISNTLFASCGFCSMVAITAAAAVIIIVIGIMLDKNLSFSIFRLIFGICLTLLLMVSVSFGQLRLSVLSLLLLSLPNIRTCGMAFEFY